MRILFISTGDAKYGAPKSMLKLMELLIHTYKCECVLLTKKHNALNDWCNDHNIENYCCFYRDIMAGDSYDKWYLNSIKHCLKYTLYLIGGITEKHINKLPIDFSKVDIIHSNTNRVDIGAYLSRKHNIPHVWHLREMDEGTKNMHYYIPKWNNYMNTNAEVFIAITEAVKKSWCAHGLDPDKVKVIYNGIATETIKHVNHQLFSGEDSRIKIVSVGRIERGKGQEDLIRALCALPEELQIRFQVDFYGDAYWDYKKYLDDIIRKNSCKVLIHYYGYCNDIGDKLQYYDIGIMCSPAEAFGRTTVEYMMAGLLTIATDSGANPELIRPRIDGILYEQGNSNALKEVLEDILANQDSFYLLAENGYIRAKQLFQANVNAEKIFHLYKNIMEQKH